MARLLAVQKDSRLLDDPLELRYALLDFIADFADWDNATDPAYLELSRKLVGEAHSCLGGAPGSRPLVVDPFAGGGAIPLEALRVGADAFASDVNRLAVLLERATLRTIPTMGKGFSKELRRWGARVLERATEAGSDLYGPPRKGARAIAFIWARTVQCEGPGCGCTIPMLGSMWLAKKQGRSWAIVPAVDKKARTVELRIENNPRRSDVPRGFCDGGSAVCPVCEFTTAVSSVRRQLRERNGGSWDARLVAVVETSSQGGPKTYRSPTDAELALLARLADRVRGGDCWVPDAPLPPKGTLGFRIQNYGMRTWADAFLPRQLLVLNELVSAVEEMRVPLQQEVDPEVATAIDTCLGLALSKCVDYSNALCRWVVGSEAKAGEFVGAANGGENKLSMKWDFAEANPLAGGSGSWEGVVEWMARVCDHLEQSQLMPATVERASATAIPLPDSSATVVITDPPYYDAFAYAALADMFYVWLRRLFPGEAGFDASSTMTAEEIIADESAMATETQKKDRAFFEASMQQALVSCRRITVDDGLAVVVFAHKGTASWEALLAAFVASGWTVVASWPLDTERSARPRALRSAALGSSIHIVGRKRPLGRIGDWRAVLSELPPRVHEWLERLAHEGVVGADAIFACLGPALEIYSRFDRVETASGETIPLEDVLSEAGVVLRRGYLSYVWETVAQQALGMIFADADASGLEADARLTAMWLWTLSTGSLSEPLVAEDGDASEENGRSARPKAAALGYSLEYDAARKISQGLGIHLKDMGGMVQIDGDTCRLLAVTERARSLFGQEDGQSAGRPRKAPPQLSLGFGGETDARAEDPSQHDGPPRIGESVLDRLHQAMLLFGAGRTAALKSFLVGENVGADVRFWRLAQALAALYPPGSQDRRWVEGLLARKKGLGY